MDSKWMELHGETSDDKNAAPDEAFALEYNPGWNYKIDRVPAYLCRGTFHKVGTGKFLGYSHRVKEYQVDIEMQQCPKCLDGRWWVTAADLREAEGVIECEKCGTMLKPVCAGVSDLEPVITMNPGVPQLSDPKFGDYLNQWHEKYNGEKA